MKKTRKKEGLLQTVVKILVGLTTVAVAYVKVTAKPCPRCGKELTVINNFVCTECKIQLRHQ